MDEWMAALRRQGAEAAWDAFLERYRRLIFAAIRHYAQDYDDVMDVFARVCEALRADGLRRLRTYAEQPDHKARFSTWLVTVVRHLTVDWFRERDGRRRLSTVAEALPPLQRAIFQSVFLEQRSHVETYERLHASVAPALSFREFLIEVRATYRAATKGRQGTLLQELGAPLPAEESVAGEPEAEAGERRDVLEEALASLSADDRLAVELYVLEELPADAVAKVLGVPNAKAVYNRVYRALAVLRETLERAGVRRGDL
jgi:RNA polymerase sigma factor (sigma-70 family)